jgi:hypothetical protein
LEFDFQKLNLGYIVLNKPNEWFTSANIRNYFEYNVVFLFLIDVFGKGD